MGLAGPVDEPPDDRRRRLQRLDDCLQLLEAAHEAGYVEVDEEIAEALHDRAPSIPVGTPIAAAIEEVFRLQEPLLLTGHVVDDIYEDRRRRPRRPVDLEAILGHWR